MTRRLKIIHLAVLHRPQIAANTNRHDHQCQWHHHVQNAHAVSDVNVVLNQLHSTTVSELTGIMTAATSGVI